MYVSRLLFHTVPGKTGQVEQELRRLREMVSAAGGIRARILHAHFASLGAADVVFEQEAPDVAALEQQISKLTGSATSRHGADECQRSLSSRPSGKSISWPTEHELRALYPPVAGHPSLGATG